MTEKVSKQVERNKLPPPGLLDFLTIIPIFKNEKNTDDKKLHDKSIRDFEVKAIFDKQYKFGGEISLDIKSDTGNSFFKIEKNAIKLRVEVQQGNIVSGTKKCS